MNFIQYNPFAFSAIIYSGETLIITTILLTTKRKYGSLALFLLPLLTIAPLMLSLSGYYIVREQKIVCLVLFSWGLLKAMQMVRTKLSLSLRSHWILRTTLTGWIVALPYSWYLSCHPVTTDNVLSCIGLILIGLSLLWEIMRTFLSRNVRRGSFYDIFHPGTILLIWGLFTVMIPQLLGTDWLLLTGPLLFSVLAIRPWVFLLSGSHHAPVYFQGISDSADSAGNSIYPFPENIYFEKGFPSTPHQELLHSDRKETIPRIYLHYSDRGEGDRGYGI